MNPDTAARISRHLQDVIKWRHLELIGNGHPVQMQERRRDLQYVSLVLRATLFEARTARQQEAFFTMIA